MKSVSVNWQLVVKLILCVILVCISKVSSQPNYCTTCDEVDGKDHSSGSNSDSEINITGNLIDPTANPCDNYYQYACGNWEKMSEAKNFHFENARDILEILYEKAMRKYKTIIEQQQHQIKQQTNSRIISSSSGESSRTKITQYYNSCLEYYRLPRLERLKPFLDEIKLIGNWPISDTSSTEPSLTSLPWSTTANWINMVGYLRRYGVQTLFREIVKTNWKNSSQQAVYLVQPKLPFFRKYGNLTLVDEDEAFIYKMDIKHLLLDLGLKIRKAKEITNEIFNFEMNLVTFMRQESTIDVPDPQTISELIKKFPSIRWESFMNIVYGKSVAPSTIVIVQEDYFFNLERLIHRTNFETLKKYFFVKFLLHFKEYLDDQDVAWRFCLKDVSSKMGASLESMSDSLNPENIRKQQSVKEIFSQIKNTFKEILMNLEWIRTTTKLKAIDKLNLLKFEIGNSFEQMNNADSFYKDFKVNTSSYGSNILRYAQFETQKDHLRLENPSTMYENLDPLKANSYHQLSQNKIKIPSIILELPLYDESLPLAAKFGGLGSILGHELVHGFDLDGKNYDANGNAVDWWDVRSFLKYWEKAQCLVTQNRNKGESKGIITLNEDIADSSGLKLSFETYKRYRSKENGRTRENITGLNLGDEQLFFLSFAQIFCSSNDAPRQKSSGKSKHVEHKSRVIKALSNFEPFSQKYSCPLGSKMNSIIKCELW